MSSEAKTRHLTKGLTMTPSTVYEHERTVEWVCRFRQQPLVHTIAHLNPAFKGYKSQSRDGRVEETEVGEACETESSWRR